MKRLFLCALVAAAAVLAWPGVSRAQLIPTPPPTPTPDPQVYQDAAMWFRAPDAFRPGGQRHVSLDDLGQDMIPLAVWIYPNKDHPRRIILQAESFQGSVGDWDGEFEQQMRSQFDSPLFRDRTNFALKNGMPAMFMTMSSGEGFNVQKFYIVIWADSQRGMALMLVAGLDDLSDAAARAMLSDVTAVQYPLDR